MIENGFAWSMWRIQQVRVKPIFLVIMYLHYFSGVKYGLMTKIALPEFLIYEIDLANRGAFH